MTGAASSSAPSAPLALVTGGVRRVGGAIAGRLAQAGYRLALHGHRDATPEPALQQILSAQGSIWHGFTADFADPQAADQLLDAVTDHFGGPPDLLVNSASIFGKDDASNLTSDTLMAQMQVNMIAPTLLSVALARLTPAGQRAAVVQILDQRITNPNRDQLSYTLSKQALAQTVRTLAVACAETLRVNAVAPGLTLTAGEYSATQLANITAMMPLQQLPNPRDIAEAVLYLAGAEAVTGQIIWVDGGTNLKSFDRDFVHLGK